MLLCTAKCHRNLLGYSMKVGFYMDIAKLEDRCLKNDFYSSCYNKIRRTEEIYKTQFP